MSDFALVIGIVFGVIVLSAMAVPVVCALGAFVLWLLKDFYEPSERPPHAD